MKMLTTIDPFIIDDKRRGAYNRGIATWHESHDLLFTSALEAQRRFQANMEVCRLLQYARLPEDYRKGKA